LFRLANAIIFSRHIHIYYFFIERTYLFLNESCSTTENIAVIVGESPFPLTFKSIFLLLGRYLHYQ
jgi:hypothetical protein